MVLKDFSVSSSGLEVYDILTLTLMCHRKLLAQNAKHEKKGHKMEAEEIIKSRQGTPKLLKTVIQVSVYSSTDMYCPSVSLSPYVIQVFYHVTFAARCLLLTRDVLQNNDQYRDTSNDSIHKYWTLTLTSLTTWV